MISMNPCLRSFRRPDTCFPARDHAMRYRITRRSFGTEAKWKSAAAPDGEYNNSADVQREISERAASEGKGTLPLVIYFTASWCGPCKLVTKEIYKVQLTHQFKLLTVDIDVEKEFASSLKVRTVPTIVFVGTAPADSPALSTHGNVSSKLLADILDNKLQYAGGDIKKMRRLS